MVSTAMAQLALEDGWTVMARAFDCHIHVEKTESMAIWGPLSNKIHASQNPHETYKNKQTVDWQWKFLLIS